MYFAISARRFALSFLLSLIPSWGTSGFHATAAATTGPAKEPRPHSSIPTQTILKKKLFLIF
jgi:hypothetical protein